MQDYLHRGVGMGGLNGSGELSFSVVFLKIKNRIKLLALELSSRYTHAVMDLRIKSY